MRRAPRSRVAMLATLMVAVGGGACTVWAPQSRAAVTEETASFEGFAEANGFVATFSNPGVIPIGLVLKGAGPTSQATLTSLGTSGALSSFPDFGEAQTLPGLAGSLVGVPVPPTPNYVQTQAGDQPVDRSAPGVSLHAESGDSVAQAITVAGSASTGYTSTARVERRIDQGVSATSRALASGLDVLGTLRISAVDSRASAIREPTGKLLTASSLSMSGISVPALAVAVPQCTPSSVPIPVPVAGLPPLPPVTLEPLCAPEDVHALLGDGPIPIPQVGFQDGFFTTTIPALGSQTMAVPADQVLSALAQSGITVTYQQAEELRDRNGKPNGIRAPVLSFTVSGEVPPPFAQYIPGTSTFVVQFGSTTAALNYATTSATPLAGFTGDIAADLAGGGVQASGVDLATAPTAPGMGLLPATAVGAAPSAARGDLSLSAAGAVGAGAASGLDLSRLYLLAVVAALGAFGAGQAVRLLGVLRSWNS